MNHLKEILKMIEANMDFFMIKTCLSMIGYKSNSMSMPGLREEVESLISHKEMELEAESFTFS